MCLNAEFSLDCEERTTPYDTSHDCDFTGNRRPITLRIMMARLTILRSGQQAWRRPKGIKGETEFDDLPQKQLDAALDFRLKWEIYAGQ